jgi:hypothetical protein
MKFVRCIPKRVGTQLPSFIIHIAVIAVLLLHGVPLVSAASPVRQMIRVSPVIQAITLTPGKKMPLSIVVENLTDSPLPISASVEGFDVSDTDGEIIPGIVKPSINQLSSWVHIETPDTLIPGKEKIVVPVTISVPSTVPFGGYYAMIQLTPLVPLTSSSSPVIIPKVGVLILAGVGTSNFDQSEQSLSVLQTNIGWIYSRGPVPLSLRIKNASLMHQTVKVWADVTPLFGALERFNAPEQVVFPGKTRIFQTSLYDAQKGPSILTTDIHISGGAGKTITLRRYMIVFPWEMTLLCLFIGSTVIVSIRYRSRIYASIRILFSRTS